MNARLARLGFLGFALSASLPRAMQAQRIAEVQIAPPFMRMVQDAQAQLVATAYDLDGAPLNVRFRWTSSNINIATVAADGLVRAIAPGSVLITVSAESDGRRVVTRATVQVMRTAPRPGGPVVVVGPMAPNSLAVTVRPGRPTPSMPPAGALPGAPGMPGAMPPPGGAPGDAPPTRPNEPRRIVFDSVWRASVNCNEPFLNAANPMHACWDERATLRDSAFVAPPRPANEHCAKGEVGVMLLVQVNEHGRVDGVLPFTSSSCSEYTQAAMEAARRLTFNPATRGGQPIRAWVRLQARPE